MSFSKYFLPFKNLFYFYFLVNLILRIILIFHPITQTNFGILTILKIFLLGGISDFLIFCIGSIFFWLYLLFISNSKLQKPWGILLFIGYTTLFLYVASGKSILHEYGGVLPAIGLIFIGFKTVLLGLLIWLPKYRRKIRLVIYFFTLFLFVLIIIQNAISEFFFWNEFGVRYNFIAVDYLVYTNTVIGNIIESYPVLPLFIGVGILSFVSTYFIAQKSKVYLEHLPSLSEKVKLFLVYGILFIVSLKLIPIIATQENSQNVFTNELQANGMYKFYFAFMQSELDFFKFYKTIPTKEAYALLKNQIPNIENSTTFRPISSNSSEVKKNVVLITIESLSADFMKMYGNEQNLTPFLIL